MPRPWAAAVLASAAWLLAASALAAPGPSASQFCDRSAKLTAAQQDSLLRFSALVRDELSSLAVGSGGTGAGEGGAVLISRSGLDLSRFNIRYSHAAVAWNGPDGRWTVRQLYYACDESRPRIYDQGLAGFVMGTDNPARGYISMVTLPPAAAAQLRQAAQDDGQVLNLLAHRYSANAYAYGLAYQNCNQWLVELLATAWGQLPPGDALRGSAQQWLAASGYAPEPVHVTHWQIFAAHFVPLLHLDDHPADDRLALALRISLPASVEGFVHQRLPDSQRVEICHDGQNAVVHHGWTAVAPDCVALPGDRTVKLRP